MASTHYNRHSSNVGLLLSNRRPQAPRAEVVLVLSRSRSVTPADRGNYDLIEAGYNYINSSRPPKILESPLDSKSLMAGWFLLPRSTLRCLTIFFQI